MHRELGKVTTERQNANRSIVKQGQWRTAGASLCIALGATTLASAAPISIVDPSFPSNPFQIMHQYVVVGPSSYYGPGGTNLLIGVDYVDPDGKTADDTGASQTPTTGFATQAGTTIPLSFLPTGFSPKAYFGFTNDMSLTGSWEITLENESDVLSFATPTIDTSRLAEKLTGPLLSDLGTTTPKLTWESPSTLPDFIDVTIFDIENINPISGAPAVVGFFRLDPDATEFIAPDGLLSEDRFYSYSLSAVVLRDDGQVSSVSGISLDGGYESVNTTYYDFYTGDYGDGVVSVVLPEVDTSTGAPVFRFDKAVEAGILEFWDPMVAIGYDYQIGTGDPNFASFLLPNIGDGIFELYLFDTTAGEYIFDMLVDADTQYFFDDGGVDRFRILGIEPSAGLDPEDPTAFATGLSFVASGRFTGTMTPISVEVAPVPLPAGLTLLVAGLGSICLVGRRGRRAQEA